MDMAWNYKLRIKLINIFGAFNYLNESLNYIFMLKNNNKFFY